MKLTDDFTITRFDTEIEIKTKPGKGDRSVKIEIREDADDAAIERALVGNRAKIRRAMGSEFTLKGNQKEPR